MSTSHAEYVKNRLSELAHPDPPPLTDAQRLALWKQEWRTTPALRQEFGTEAVYLAFARARHEGRIGPRLATTV